MLTAPAVYTCATGRCDMFLWADDAKLRELVGATPAAPPPQLATPGTSPAAKRRRAPPPGAYAAADLWDAFFAGAPPSPTRAPHTPGPHKAPKKRPAEDDAVAYPDLPALGASDYSDGDDIFADPLPVRRGGLFGTARAQPAHEFAAALKASPRESAAKSAAHEFEAALAPPALAGRVFGVLRAHGVALGAPAARALRDELARHENRAEGFRLGRDQVRVRLQRAEAAMTALEREREVERARMQLLIAELQLQLGERAEHVVGFVDSGRAR